MKRLAILLLFAAPVLLLACPGIRRPPATGDLCGGHPCIQIGTFNAYWLGANRRYQRPLRTADEVRQMAAWLADDLDLEVIVLQEVNASVDREDDGDVFASDRFRWFCNALGERGYRLQAGDSGDAQRVVLAFDADEVDLLTPAKDLPVRDSFRFDAECGRGGLRRPLAARLRAGSFDFWIVGVHLKSKRGGECSDRIRDGQARDLATAIDDLVRDSGEPDVILTGDFNATAGEASIAALRSPGAFSALTTREHRGRGSGEVSYLIEPYRSLIDHVMVRRRPTTEWVENSTIVYPAGRGKALERYTELYSDHAPVWASFYTDRDDD
ncbi:MAG: endonuclease/exonuclease/phosphatase family protein [Thermoanaerobaculia bacterium]